MDRNSSKYWNRHYRPSISAYSKFRLEKIFVVIFSLNRNNERKGFHSRVSNDFPKLINPNLHNVLDCVRGLHGDGEGHDPLPLCLDVMWCPLRRWFTHRPEGTLGLQSFLHSRRHVVHEQGFGPPPQDNTEPRELARTRTLKTRGDRAIFNGLLKRCAFKEKNARDLDLYSGFLSAVVWIEWRLQILRCMDPVHSCYGGRCLWSVEQQSAFR